MEQQILKLSEAQTTVLEIAEIEYERADHATLGTAPIHLWHYERLTEIAKELGEVIHQLDKKSS